MSEKYRLVLKDEWKTINPKEYIGRKGIFLCLSDYFWEGGDSEDYEEISKYKGKKFTIVGCTCINDTFENSDWDIEFEDGKVIEAMSGYELKLLKDFKLKHTKSIDSDYDYGTEDVKGEDIFDIHTTGTTGSWSDLVKGVDLDYYKNRKNLTAKIVQMTPNEYYNECAKMFRSSQGSSKSAQELKEQRAYDKETLEDLKNVILKKKKKFPICVLDLSYNPGQEGLHRMMVAGELIGWNKKFPVLLVETYDKARQERIEKQSAQREFENKVEKAINSIREWEFYDLDEFEEYLIDKLEYFGLYDTIISTNKNNLEISKFDDDIDDTLIYNIDLSKFKIGGSESE